jgi:hypothetical protein
MTASDAVFHRPQYAAELSRQLLYPGVLDEGVRSGVFLSGIRRVGKTTFVRQDLIPALENHGAVVIYVDLWTDLSKSPATQVYDAVRATMTKFQHPEPGLLKRFKGANIGAAGFSFGFQLDSIGAPGGTSLAQAVDELVTAVDADVVLIVDEVQSALQSEEGRSLLHSLKAARDAVNTKAGTKHHFLFLGTGSHKSLVTDLATRRSLPFTGAVQATYHVLGEDFVQWQLGRVSTTPGAKLPSLGAAMAGFKAMGSRPEELLKALRQLQGVVGTPADEAFGIICQTLACAAADAELRAIEDFGALGQAIFGRIAAGDPSGVTGVFGERALADYSRQTGVAVEAGQVQGLADKMVAANLIARPAHGRYAVVDPFVQEVWRSRSALLPGTSEPGTLEVDEGRNAPKAS